MRRMIIESLSRKDCEAVVKALEGKTRYKLHVEFEQYTQRKYKLRISTEVDYNVAQARFDDEVITTLIRSLRKAMRRCSCIYDED